MYIGDSLSLNIYESLLCLLHAAVPQAKYNQVILRENVTVTFLDYGVEIVLFHSNLLVDIEVEKIGRVLKLDSIKDGQIWKNFDLLIFNTWLWYTRRPPGQHLYPSGEHFVPLAMLTVFSRFYSDAIAKKLVHIGRNTTRIISKQQEEAKITTSNCNLFEGSWVIDDDVIDPLYNTTTCPFIRNIFDCTNRPDRQYLKYKWQPSACNLPRFDGRDFLRKYKGKQIMFIGDSLSLNNYESFLCLLYVSVPGMNYKTKLTNQSVTVIFEDYEVLVTLFNSLFLVDVEVEPNIGRILKLNSIKNGEIWKQADVLIFNTWLWWTRGKPKQPWDYIEDGGRLVKDMNRITAFQRGLNTWVKWVETHVDPTKTKVFYQGEAASHHQ
ncbi:hypothetical protein KY289_002004 [Solanum tuberosum]|nr:hypothetical protein KY289_002004 [Solanum tuberosum]